MKEYLMLIRENLDNYKKMAPQEMQGDIAKHVTWVEKLVMNDNFKASNPLMPIATYSTG